MIRFRFVEDHHDAWGVKRICRVLEISRSSFYAWRAGRPAAEARAREEDVLAGEIAEIHRDSMGAYGVPRVHATLRRSGRAVNRKKVERIMRERRIRGITRRRRRSLTKADTTAAPAPDLIARDFTAKRPGTRLVGDITYLPTAQGWYYLATAIDLATREVLGWSMADHHRADLVIDALRMAHARGDLEEDCIFHSDRGSEYTSREFRSEIHKLTMRQSMGRVGTCYDNAAAESFFAILKAEIGTEVWLSKQAARADVFTFIEVNYNRRRLRKDPELGYVTPLEARLRYSPHTTLAA
ncbi:IS3 family transposase [Actinopolymorpha pittospori]|uniref:Transposase InsO family protein n=2 Tax=Actinopolymorpha pittospori TaxID=648752 RepID=A0A927RJD3_9ACTN|nr:transposase InsO family protein [Actinopolymorpha pittospori]